MTTLQTSAGGRERRAERTRRKAMAQQTELQPADAEVQTLPVAIFADFVCPYSFLAAEQIDRLAQDYDVRPIWRPHWLHPETPLEGAPRHADEHSPRRGAVAAWLKEM